MSIGHGLERVAGIFLFGFSWEGLMMVVEVR
jgi:hypothetical protein